MKIKIGQSSLFFCAAARQSGVSLKQGYPLLRARDFWREGGSTKFLNRQKRLRECENQKAPPNKILGKKKQIIIRSFFNSVRIPLFKSPYTIFEKKNLQSELSK